ncbi:MAG TPA: condensation domain-containing protein, partial [Cytophagales bacterium]
MIEYLSTHRQEATAIDIPRIEGGREFPLSSAQRRLWVLSQYEEGNGAYNVPSVYVFEGNLDVDALRTAFNTLIERHESLRTRFTQDESGEARQVVLPAGEAPFEI